MSKAEQDNPDETRKNLHHRIYPYMDHFVQYATETEIKEGGEDRPWIVRDRSSALRNERRGYGRALVRTWIPGDWEWVNEESTEGKS